MTTDKQIEAVEKAHHDWYLKEYYGECVGTQGRYRGTERYRTTRAAYLAAIAATHEQYKPLVEALLRCDEFLEVCRNFFPNIEDITGYDEVCAAMTEALANLSEESRG